jgi:hypothetical protein
MFIFFKEERAAVKDSWDDEDVDNIKDDWDDPDPEPVVKPVAKPVAKPAPAPAKPVKDVKDMTEEEKKQAQIDADFNNAKELFGLEKSLDEISFDSKEDFKNYIARFELKMSFYNVCLFKNF